MLTLNTELRVVQGTGASRRLRHRNTVPAIIYGGKQAPPVSIQLNQDELLRAEANGGFYDAPLTLVVDGQATLVKVQAVQRHPFKPKFQHFDFLRVTS